MKQSRLLWLFATILFAASSLYAQTTEITGTVVDENNEAVFGATVRSKADPSKGTTTNLDGQFKINVKEGSTIVISFVGYKTVEVKAKKGMHIKLAPDAELLGEVVVTGMVAQDKRLFTGATDQLDGDKVKLNGMADVSRGLEGRAAGVTVQNVSGTFGTAPKIRVRGATSIYGNSSPLWVVDGVIQESVVEVGPDELSSGDATTLISSAIAGLNPDDIESFQILKDGSATSIYGAKAMAGVIVITTKKGRKGTANFSYTGEFTSRLVPSYNDFNIMNSQDQMDFYMELERKGWLNLAETYRAADSGVFGNMYHLIHSYDPKKGVFGLPNTPEAKEGYLKRYEMINTDWFAELFSPAVMMNHSVSMSSGTDKSQTYASLSLMTDPGWMRSSAVRRYTANLNNTYHFTDQVSLNMIANASYRQQTAPGTLSQEADPVSGTVSRAFDINPYSYAINSSRTLDPNEEYTRNFAPFNIKKELDNNFLNLDVIDVRFQSQLEWKPIRELKLQALAAVRYSGTMQEHKIKDESNQALAYRAMQDATVQQRNNWLYKDPDKINELAKSILPKGGFYNTKNYRMLSYDFRASAQYNTVIADAHIINSYAGVEFNAQDRTLNHFDGWGMQYQSGELAFWDYLAFKRMKEMNIPYYSLVNTRNRTHALFGTATYSYLGRYTLTGTARYEGSNRLGKSRQARWLPTWNIAGAWNAHEEEWFANDNLKWLTHFTLRGSYSLTADPGPVGITNPDIVLKSYTPWRPSAGSAESGLTRLSLANEDLTYEKKHEINVGVDMGFLNNRINVVFDWYRRNNFDLIGYAITQGVGGETNRLGNVAAMKSKGVEFSLSTRNIETPDFSWTTDFIFGYNTNEITELHTRSTVFNFISGSGFARKGYPVRGLFSIPFEGLDDRGYPKFKIQDRVVDSRDYGSINLQERDNVDYLKYEGPTDPTINGSFGNILNYKEWRLNLFVTYSAGNVIRLDPVFRARYDDLTATPREFNNRWVVGGDEARTIVPAVPSYRDYKTISRISTGFNTYNYSSARVAKGDFVRLKEVSLTYTMPKKWLEGTVLQNASLKLQATNLLLLYADPALNGQDPEFFRSGGVSAPVPKQITATVRVGF